jgi:hypothetical protein
MQQAARLAIAPNRKLCIRMGKFHPAAHNPNLESHLH